MGSVGSDMGRWNYPGWLPGCRAAWVLVGENTLSLVVGCGKPKEDVRIRNWISRREWKGHTAVHCRLPRFRGQDEDINPTTRTAAIPRH